MPPANEGEVRSRARKRFLVAFLWAFGIWTLLGYVFSLSPRRAPPLIYFFRHRHSMFIGGTVEDAREQGRHRRHSGRHNPQRPIDDAPPMDPHPHPTHTWHKISPTPTEVVVPVETGWVIRSEGASGASEEEVGQRISIDELE